MSIPPIDSFRGENRFLSNFFPSPVWVEGKRYPTVEHAFQAAKTHDHALRERIRWAPTPGDAKRMGRSLDLRPDWERVRLDVMDDLLRQKFRSPALRARLLETHPAILIEGNTWGDRYWGAVLVERTTPWDGDEEVPCWDGENHLGRLLMEIRDEIVAAH